MDLIHHLMLGFSVAFTGQNLLCALVGALLGTLIGVLPGIGPVAAIAMLLPSIYGLDATPALIMLAGVYYGAQYGGSTAAILINMPGEPSSAVTAIDGHQMARQGRAGTALSVAALGSFFAGCVSTALVAALASPLAAMALAFGPQEYFSLMALGLTGAVVLASGSLLKATAMTLLGLALSQVNTDAASGIARFNFDRPELADGIGFVVIAMGLFGVGEVIANLGRRELRREVYTRRVDGLWPTRQTLRDAGPAVLRGTALGSLLGLLPGGGALLASFAAYGFEKRAAGDSGKFGRGDIRGVAAPESANNAGAQTAFVPMLALGVPPNAVMALLLGAMALKGIPPGPQAMSGHPQFFWGLIASMWVGNAMLVILNLPLVGIWIRLLALPYRVLYPAITVLCCIGVYALRYKAMDVYLTAAFAALGYVFYKLRCDPAPLLLGFILGPMMEKNLRTALLDSGGDWSTFVSRPLSAGMLLVSALMVVSVLLPSISKKRELAFVED